MVTRNRGALDAIATLPAVKAVTVKSSPTPQAGARSGVGRLAKAKAGTRRALDTRKMR